jgi:hypothetical protein
MSVLTDCSHTESDLMYSCKTRVSRSTTAEDSGLLERDAMLVGE